MGMARNAGSGDKRSWFDVRRNTPRGAPVPGTGVRHYHKGRSGSNKSGSLSKLNLEWGSTARKQEDEQRGINNRARQQAIADQLAEMSDEAVEEAQARAEENARWAEFDAIFEDDMAHDWFDSHWDTDADALDPYDFD